MNVLMIALAYNYEMGETHRRFDVPFDPIYVGNEPNDGTGDSIEVALTKVIGNFGALLDTIIEKIDDR